MVEQSTVNRLVVGSSPTRGAIWDEQSQKLCFSLYSRALLAVRKLYFRLSFLPTSVLLVQIPF